MYFPTILLTLLALFTTSIHGCAHYLNCKCHDSKDNLQNDWVTEQACDKYKTDHGSKQLKYKGAPHHQCVGNPIDDGTRSMDNCEWDKACKSYGTQYYQWCWEKLW
ncbi:Ecp28-2 [Fulvia fulva]|uniref:Ecp28-2 n=1 Tax=Passalora fulva TaxID=5499 RepID=A0A1P8YXM1_PASFU|nr:Ecp28-2 [Fulvia fulva]AQA29259.1 extracellular protein 28-2 [Fulvia fulva]KAK4620239.1 Ecp28-2 [Fulvia fulva]KAK4620945.1 Ecp28-2 [Fulvia fulva]UJO19611.1 Ecp28-2 [Fulvia fulva]WPV17603.1 Ecp28-2 [Fulvia fulva]